MVSILYFMKILMVFGICSIPFGIYVCQWMGLEAPNTYGSKNIGATNVARQNKIAGALTLLLDVSKGFLALKLLTHTDVAVCMAITGHCFSPFLNFKGGKGVATCAGALFASSPAVATVLMMVWVTSFIKTRTAGTSSIIASVIFLIYAATAQSLWLAVAASIIIIKHKSNVKAISTPA